MSSSDHAGGDCFTEKLGQRNHHKEQELRIVRHHDVRRVLEGHHHCSIVALGQELKETLRHKLRSHQSSKVFDCLETFRPPALIFILQAAGHDLRVSEGGADGLVPDVVAAGGQGPGESHHSVFGHHVGHQPIRLSGVSH